MSSKVSVIVPIYNVEAYLSRCLDSLCCQTLREIEIILIDDGSTDSSGRIADQYTRGDDRFRVVHQPNQGLSAARNAGIELAQAEYIMFADSDDWVEPDFCCIPYELAVEHGADMVLFRCWRDGFSYRNPVSIPLPDRFVPQEQVMDLLHHGGGLGAWSKLYHRRLFAQIRYPVGRVYEDVGTTYKLVHEAEHIWAANAILYHYCFRVGSIVNTPTEKNLRDKHEMLMQEARGLESYGFTKLANEVLASASLSYLVSFGRHADCSATCVHTLRNEKQTLQKDTWRRKALQAALFRFPPLFDLACILFGKRIRKRMR